MTIKALFTVVVMLVAFKWTNSQVDSAEDQTYWQVKGIDGDSLVIGRIKGSDY